MIHLLIADDEMLERAVLCKTLKKNLGDRCRIFQAENGREALSVYEREKIRIAILDIEMPEMDGHRLTKLVKTDDVLKQIPLIIFSSLVNDEMRRKGEALGADAQLTKPEIGSLVEAIDGLIDKKIRS